MWIKILFFEPLPNGCLKFFKKKCLKIKWHLDLAKLVTWGDSHCGVVQLQISSRLPGWHSRADCSHKDGENKTWILSLFFFFCPIYVPFTCNFFEASHWPSGHMIRSRPLIGPQVTWSDPGLSLRPWEALCGLRLGRLPCQRRDKTPIFISTLIANKKYGHLSHNQLEIHMYRSKKNYTTIVHWKSNIHRHSISPITQHKGREITAWPATSSPSPIHENTGT